MCYHDLATIVILFNLHSLRFRFFVYMDTGELDSLFVWASSSFIFIG